MTILVREHLEQVDRSILGGAGNGYSQTGCFKLAAVGVEHRSNQLGHWFSILDNELLHATMAAGAVDSEYNRLRGGVRTDGPGLVGGHVVARSTQNVIGTLA